MMRPTNHLSRLGAARQWITAFALLAFFLQSLVIQTHVHQLFQPAAVKVLDGGTHRAPPKPDPVDQCRLCQELVHAGSFVAPSATASPLSLTTVAIGLSQYLALVADPAPAQAWQSRAPPRR